MTGFQTKQYSNAVLNVWPKSKVTDHRFLALPIVKAAC